MVDNGHSIMRPEHAGHAGRLAILGVRIPAAASVRTSAGAFGRCLWQVVFADAFRRCLSQRDATRGRPPSSRPLRCSTSTRTGLNHLRSGLRDARHGARGRDVPDHPDPHGIAEGQCPGDEGSTSPQDRSQTKTALSFITAPARLLTSADHEGRSPRRAGRRAGSPPGPCATGQALRKEHALCVRFRANAGWGTLTLAWLLIMVANLHYPQTWQAPSRLSCSACARSSCQAPSHS